MASQDIPVDFEDSLLNTHHMQQYHQGKNVSQTATGKYSRGKKDLYPYNISTMEMGSL